MKCSNYFRWISAAVFVFIAVGVAVAAATDPQVRSTRQDYTIATTWNNQSVAPADRVNISFFAVGDGKNLGIEISAPFYNDPPPNGPPGRFDGLWDYEVVEAFFLGERENYLELEFGPHQHYLAYYLEGVRNVVNSTLGIQNYNVEIQMSSEKIWTGRALVPAEYFPPGLNAFNAYAIHGTDESRVYMSLFPVGFNTTPQPDFHLLQAFQPIDLSAMIEIR